MGEERCTAAGAIALIVVLAIMIILLAVLAVVVVEALAGSPWGLVTVAATLPIALLMGVYLRWIRPGRVGDASALGFVLLLAALVLRGRVRDRTASWGTELRHRMGCAWKGFSGSLRGASPPPKVHQEC